MNVYFFIHPFRKSSVTLQALSSVEKQTLKPTIIQLPSFNTLLYFMQIYRFWQGTNIRISAHDMLNLGIVAMINQALDISRQTETDGCIWFDDVWIEPRGLEIANEALKNHKVVGIRSYDNSIDAPNTWFCFQFDALRPFNPFSFFDCPQFYIKWLGAQLKNIHWKDLSNDIEWKNLRLS